MHRTLHPDSGSTAAALAHAAATAGALALLICSAAAFLPHQSLWVDETTQLSGIGLGPRQLLDWLIGNGPDLGVPADRMPPGSYLLQMGWSAIFGLSEAKMRWLSIAFVVIGALFTATAAWRAYNRVASTATAALFLALSPNVVGLAVEIRAYPAFLMLSGIGTYLLVRTLQSRPEARPAWLAVLSAVLIAAGFTHFFGLVYACATLGALLL